ncbi:PilT protein domain protein [Chloroherpeton thalassium ATCC 35110]|uniref:PilT protein domain protein n=1 Tax=Chloroherpeton thalassium (strain ATCC 35110 / GB-78) TaxID=517418 RepID=B3QUZ6_CHLT3|nr:PIN domain-containing protein [Chloroherpeton thalassium]ACF14497.1 PilT protein domain protein [Chloroherpeton thalassium ATCC 35110]
MSDRFFIDTNIFVYSFDVNQSSKCAISRKLIQKALQEKTGCISTQVIQEFLNVSAKKFNPPLQAQDRIKYLDKVLAPLCRIYPSFELYRQSIDISERWQYSFYDSLIIAAAIQANCSILYSEDMQHGQNILLLTVKNPFLISK